jgi:chromosome segregation ATPase
LTSLRDQIAEAQSELVSTRSQLDSSQKQLASLQEDYTTQQTELQTTKQEIQVTDLRLAELQGEYDNLHAKYDKLVKPARSASNKYVVEVRYFKSGGDYRIQYREPEDAGFRDLSRAELDQRLSKLSADMPDALYVKVIIPDDSGLSYTEAWRFTSDMHTRYDYYFRGQ